MTAFTKALAIDEAVHGVRVNSIAPSNIVTPSWVVRRPARLCGIRCSCVSYVLQNWASQEPNPEATKRLGGRWQTMHRMGALRCIP